MSNFEMKYTVRLYDPDLVVEIGNLYKAHSKEFRNKNEFMTCLIRLGVDALKAKPPTAPANAAVPPAAALNKLYDAKDRKHCRRNGQVPESAGTEDGRAYCRHGKTACVALQYEFRRTFGRAAVTEKSRGRIFR